MRVNMYIYVCIYIYTYIGRYLGGSSFLEMLIEKCTSSRRIPRLFPLRAGLYPLNASRLGRGTVQNNQTADALQPVVLNRGYG